MYAAIITVIVITILSGCSSYDYVTQQIAENITSYKITVMQGNFVSQEKISQLHVGMTRKEVQNLLCNPILSDIFHTDRLNYLFYFNRSSTRALQKRDLVVFFSGDYLIKWTITDNIPSSFDPF